MAVDTIEVFLLMAIFGFIGVFLYKLYKVICFAEDYTIQKSVLSMLIGFFLYGIALFIVISEFARLTMGYFLLFRFTSLFFVLFFIFTFIDLFLLMKNWANLKNTPKIGGATRMLEKYT